MQEWRTPTGAIAITLWLLIIFSEAFGCGNDGPDSIGLPNGYTLSAWDWEETWIQDRDGQRVGDKHFSIAECQAQGDLFFGTYREYHRNDQRIRAYFIVDTASNKYQPFMDKDKWEVVLSDLGGVENVNLVPVSTFASRDRAAAVTIFGRIILTIVIGTLVIIALVILYYVRANRHISPDRL